MSDLNRRRFLASSAGMATGALVAASVQGAAAPGESEPGGDGGRRAVEFRSRWDRSPDRVWLGAEYWSNPLQDWRLAGGRIECTNPALDRNVHLLTHSLGTSTGTLELRVRVRRVGGRLDAGSGSFGFRVGARGPLNEYRNNCIFGSGLDAGLTAKGGLFLGRVQSATPGTVDLQREEVELRLTAAPDGERYTVTLSAHEVGGEGRELGRVERDDISAEQLTGNLALVANFGVPARGRAARGGEPGAGTGLFSFAEWSALGSKLESHPDRGFGPILFSQYTLHDGVLKLTAQMPPMGEQDSQTVRLMIERDGGWHAAGEARIHPQARTATFRVENWDASQSVRYRLDYTLTFTGEEEEHHWEGVIARDPVEKPVITVADVSCNIHAAFPNHQYVANLAKLDPDLLAFTGDQFYESSGGYGVVRTPVDKAIVDYLRKWYLHGWTWRELMKDRPSISLPDDHDVYQGNIWGEEGAAQETTQEAGGYQMHPDWVNVVHRTQTSHHPDAHDPTPIKQGISVYYGPLTWGRISFAVLADRMFKTAPEGVVPPTGGRADHVIDPNFDPKTADLPGLKLLGDRQMAFLKEWVQDWRGADMKGVISQTIFTAMATTHGSSREVLRADYDTNGWPQTARNEALRVIRKAFAVHLAGDQHLPAVVHYGIDEHNDAGVAFAGPAVNVGYPRWWEPKESGKNRKPGAPEITGEFLDHFGNRMTVLAVVNGAAAPSGPVLELMQQKASGMGVVRFDKPKRRITIEAWPYLADPTREGTQFAGWPVVVDMLENYGRKPAAYLPKLSIQGMESPVVQVFEEKSGELVYALRIAGREFQPHVFDEGMYKVRIGEPDAGGLIELSGLEARETNHATIEVAL